MNVSFLLVDDRFADDVDDRSDGPLLGHAMTRKHTPSCRHSVDVEHAVSLIPGVAADSSHERHEISCDTSEERNRVPVAHGDVAD